MTGTTLQNCFENDLTLRLHQQIVFFAFFASSVVNEMSQLQEFSIFESRGNHRDYVPHSRLERLQFFCKNSWAWILISLLLIGLISVSFVHDSKLKSLNEENRGKAYESHDAVIDELRSEMKTLSQRSNELEFYRRAASARNCQELSDHGFKTSGEYWIDPDKRYQGQSSFLAYCDFANNLTRISPKEKMIEFSDFTSSQSLPVEYSSTRDQMVELIRYSGSCYQTIELMCTNAPISAGNFWWIDRYGKILLPLTKNNSITYNLFWLVFR